MCVCVCVCVFVRARSHTYTHAHTHSMHAERKNWAIPLLNRTPPRMTKMCDLGSCLIFVQGACMGANRYVSWGGVM